MSDRFLRNDGFLLASVGIATLAGSMFWTGFPVYLYESVQQQVSLPKAYAFAVSGSFLFSLVSGLFADLGRHRFFSVVSQFGSSLLVLVLSLLVSNGLIGVTLALLPVLYFNFAFGNVMESVWLLETKKEGQSERASDLKSKLLNRGLILTTFKLIGFALGPFLFVANGRLSLICCGVGFIGAAVLQGVLYFRQSNNASYEQVKKEPKKASELMLESMASMRELLKEPKIVLVGLFSGLLSVPLNPLFAARAFDQGGAGAASAFWLFGGLASIAGILLMKKSAEKNLASWIWPSTVWMVFALVGAFFFKDAHLIVVCGALFIFAVPLFSYLLHIEVLSGAKENEVGSKFGMVTALIEGGIFVGMCLTAAIENGLMLVSIFLMLLLSRSVLWKVTLKKSGDELEAIEAAS